MNCESYDQLLWQRHATASFDLRAGDTERDQIAERARAEVEVAAASAPGAAPGALPRTLGSSPPPSSRSPPSEARWG